MAQGCPVLLSAPQALYPRLQQQHEEGLQALHTLRWHGLSQEMISLWSQKCSNRVCGWEEDSAANSYFGPSHF